MAFRVVAARRALGLVGFLSAIVLTFGWAASAATPCGTSIVVSRGDTLSGIAKRCETSIYLLTNVNPGLDARTLRIGQVVNMPTTEDSPSVSIEPHQGPIGTGVRIDAANFPPDTVVQIGGGPPSADHMVMGQLQTNSDGRLVVSVKIPAQAEKNAQWIFVVETPNQRHKAVSEAFHIAHRTAQADRDGSITVSGMLTEVGIGCNALRARDGRLYALVGDLAGFMPGDHVRVEGTRPVSAICDRGTAIAVRHIRQGG